MKTLLTLTIIALISCKTAYIADYSFQRPIINNDCYYAIKLNQPSFITTFPITNTSSQSVLVDDQWVTANEEEVVGYGVSNDAYTSLLYLMEKGLNQHRFTNTCGVIHITRIQHSVNRDLRPGFSALTLFIPNILGMPFKKSKVSNSYLFEVYDTEGQLIYRSAHTGSGKASEGLYYGYTNTDEKAEYDATYRAIKDFMEHFNKGQ
jgi:hypothetical protein